MVGDKKTTLRLAGAKELKALMKEMGPNIAKRGGVIGTRKGALLLRRKLKQASPYVTGALSKDWSYKKIRYRGGDTVGYRVKLKKLHYYSTLELGNRKVPYPTHPFFVAAVERVSKQVLATIISETEKGMFYEAGRIYAKTKRAR